MSTLRITQEVRCVCCGWKLEVTSGGGLSQDECENYRCGLCCRDDAYYFQCVTCGHEMFHHWRASGACVGVEGCACARFLSLALQEETGVRTLER